MVGAGRPQTSSCLGRNVLIQIIARQKATNFIMMVVFVKNGMAKRTTAFILLATIWLNCYGVSAAARVGESRTALKAMAPFWACA